MTTGTKGKDGNAVATNKVKGGVESGEGVCYELKKLLGTAIPSAGLSMLDKTMAMVMSISCGVIGKNQLAAVTLCMSATNLIQGCIGMGLISVAVTYMAQSRNSCNPRQVGIYLQTAMILMGFLVTMTISILAHTYYIMVALGQDRLVAAYASEFVLIFLIGNSCRVFYRLFSRYLFCIGNFWPSVAFTILCVCLNGFLQYLFLYHTQLGFRGAALAYTISYITSVTLHVIYIYISGINQPTWSGWTRASLLEWGIFIKYLVFAAGISIVEAWVFEMGIIFSGILGVRELAASSILMQLWPIVGSPIEGVADMTSIRIGLRLGEMLHRAARLVCRIALVLAVIIGIMTAAFLLGLRNILPTMFSTNQDILGLTNNLMYVFGLVCFLTAMKRVTDGIFVGCGKQTYGGLVSFVVYVLVTAPITSCLTFLTPLRVFGYWWGMCAGLGVTALVQLGFILRTDWSREADQAQVRAKVKTKGNLDHVYTESSPLLSDTTPHSNDSDDQMGIALHKWLYIYVKRGVTIVLMVTVLIVSLTLRFVTYVPPSVASIIRQRTSNVSLSII